MAVGWVNGSWVGQWVESVQITNNLIDLDLIEIIQFCLEIYDWWRHPHLGRVYGWFGLLVVQWVNGWVRSNH